MKPQLSPTWDTEPVGLPQAIPVKGGSPGIIPSELMLLRLKFIKKNFKRSRKEKLVSLYRQTGTNR